MKEIVVAGRNIKNAICEKDPFETSGLRKVLNFGHTVGHVLEKISNHAISHGFAVAGGMRAALDIGVETGMTPPETAKWAESLLNKFELPGRELLQAGLQDATWENFKNTLAYDKKGFMQFVLLKDIGSATVAPVPEEVIRKLFGKWRPL